MGGMGMDGGGRDGIGEPVDMDGVMLAPGHSEAVAEATSSDFARWAAGAGGAPAMPRAWGRPDGSLLVRAADGTEVEVPAGGWRMADAAEMDRGREAERRALAGLEDARMGRPSPGPELEERLAADAFASLFPEGGARLLVLSRDGEGLGLAARLTGSRAEASRRVADWRSSPDGFMALATAPGRTSWFYGTARDAADLGARVLPQLFGEYFEGAETCPGTAAGRGGKARIHVVMGRSADTAGVRAALGRLAMTMEADPSGPAS